MVSETSGEQVIPAVGVGDVAEATLNHTATLTPREQP